jgi:hypothetical protein
MNWLIQRLNLFIGEIRRRKVFRTAGIYLIAAWTGVEVSATTFPLFDWPMWTITSVPLLALAGLPLVLILSWVFEVSSSGIQRHEPRAEDSSAPPPVPARVNIPLAIVFVLIGVLISAGGFGIYSHTTRDLKQAAEKLDPERSETASMRAVRGYYRAVVEWDEGNREDAIELLRQVVEEYPQYLSAQELLVQYEAGK